MSDDTVPGRPRAVKIGIAAAIVLAGLYLAAIPFNPLYIIPALVLLAAAFGLRNGSRWSGYGGALYLAARWAGDLATILRFGAPSALWVSVVFATALIGGVAYLLFRAGRALPGIDRRWSRRGWIALSTVAIITSRCVFWFSAMGLGAAGAVLFTVAYLAI